MNKPRYVPVGQGCMIMRSEEFMDGYQAGHLSYLLEAQSFKLTDEALISLVTEKLRRKEYSESYCTGYIAGWIATIATRDLKAGNRSSKGPQNRYEPEEGGLYNV